ncbi:MAG: iron-sulfur cluster assembly scaffold protein [Bauldia sp.]|nr:iron-sulfur cluster assembly scaffold protein [Bauldia sp.]
MPEAVYSRGVLDLAGNIPRIGRLADPDATATAVSRLCGATVTVDLSVDDDVVTDFAHEVQASALGQAAASVLARNIVGATAEELRALRETMRRMLRENGPPPAGRFAGLAILETVRDYAPLQPATLLPFDAVVDALDRIAAKATPSAA